MKRAVLAACLILLAWSSLQAGATLSRLPLHFEENRGQASPDALYVARGAGYSITIGLTNRVILRHLSIEFQLAGANAPARIKAETLLDGQVNYLRGSDPKQWLSGIPTFEQVRHTEAYPGIDVVYYGNQSRLEYDFVVAPGANPSDIALSFSHVDRLFVDQAGDLHLVSGRSELVQRKPVVYQQTGHGRQAVKGSYRMVNRSTVAFTIGSYDRHRTLVIDPVLTYSTFLGGSNGDDSARGIATDAAGNIYVAGITTSTDFQTRTAIQAVAGSPDPDSGFSDVFISKINPSGTGLIYSTYLGGAGDDGVRALALDGSNNVIVAGDTTSTNFPATANAVRRTCNIDPGGTCVDAFVAKLGSSGTTLAYATYLGGTGEDHARGIAVDSAGNAYVAGKTLSSDFPLVNPLSASTFQTGFLTKLSPLGSFVYSTYYGAAAIGATEIHGIAVDTAGNIAITGATPASNATGTDVFVAKFNSAGSALVFTNFIRGANDESGNAIAVDPAGGLYVTGVTETRNFPTTPGAGQRISSGGPIFRSVDSAATWLSSPPACGAGCIPRASVYALAQARSSPSTFYAGTDDGLGGGVYRSLDAGTTWSLAAAGLEIENRVWALAIDPQDPLVVYAGTRTAGVYKTTNGGASWSGTGLNTVAITALAIDPSDPSIVYAGSDGFGIFKTVNGGVSWSAVNTGLAILSVRALAIHPTVSSTLLVGTTGGLYRSVNAAATWSLSSAGLFDPNINALAMDPRNPNLVIAGTNSVGIFRSVNGGLGWLAANAGIEGSEVSAVAVDPSSGTFYAAAGAANAFRVYKSANGITWSSTGLDVPRTAALVMHPSSPGTIYAATLGGSDAFVAKWDASGNPVFVTLLGGHRDDEGNAIAVDASGNLLIAGKTSSTNFPSVGAVQTVFGGGSGDTTDAFVTKLNGAGSAISYSTFLGGSSNDVAYAIAVDAGGNAYVAGETSSSNFPTASPLGQRPGMMDAFIARIADTNTVSYSVAARGAYTSTSQGGGSGITVGYGRVGPAGGATTPSGMAIFGFRQNSTLVSEAAVPATPAITSGRIYAQVGLSVNTGIAIANPNSQPVTLTYYFTYNEGPVTSPSVVTLAANGQIASFLDQAPFNGGALINGTFTFTASAPVAVVALRGLSNERGEFLITTLPVVDLSVPAGSETALLPHFADGGGWRTQVVLVNPTESAMAGSIQFYTQSGGASVQQAYSIPARGSYRYQTAGAGPATSSGSIRIVPGFGGQTPSSVAIFSYRNAAGITVSEAGVPAVRSGVAFRLYTEAVGFFATSSVGSLQTGFAIVNAAPAEAVVHFELSSLSGAPTGLSGNITVPGNGQSAMFVSQIPGFASLPNPFQGVLRITSTTAPAGISVIGLRGRYNERGDFLITTTPPANEAAPAPTSELFFPHLADGGGYRTQFVLFNGGIDQVSTGVLRFFGQAGQTLSLSVR